MHQIWVGNEPIPKDYKIMQQSFLKTNKDWKYRFWDDKTIDGENLSVSSIYNQVNNPILKADIARYEIVYKYGGYYSDMDFLFIKSFNPLTSGSFACTLAPSKKIDGGEIYNGLFGSEKGHGLLKTVIDSLSKTCGPLNLGTLFNNYGTYFFTRIISENINNYDNCNIYDHEMFYPMPAALRDTTEGGYRGAKRYVFSESYAIHTWGGAWMKQL